MKKICLLLLAMFGLVGLKAQSVAQPKDLEFSTSGKEVWYYMQFKSGDGVIADQGQDKLLKTEEALKTDAQLWKIVGSSLSNCELINKGSGRKIYFDGSRFKSGNRAGRLFIRPTNLKDFAPAWEVGASNTSGQTMNQNGGKGIGKEIGVWSSDSGNPLLFVLTKDILIKDALPEKLTEYTCSGAKLYRPKHLNTLWYKQPAISNKRKVDNPWMEYALPIGNGEFGAMIFAGVRRDLIQFNEKTLWGGNDRGRSPYRNFGQLYIDNLDESIAPIKDYVRYLDIEDAIAGTEYKSADGGTTFTRQYIASNPDKAILIHMKAEGSKKLNHKIFLYNANGGKASYKNGMGAFSGKLDIVSFNAQLKVVAKDGEISSDDTGITVKNASEVTLYLVGGTNYDPIAQSYTYDEAQLVPNMSDRLAQVSTQPWDAVLEKHLADYKPIYNRVKLNLAGATNNTETEQLVKDYNLLPYKEQMASPKELMLELLYFNYGRYMLIASSRGVAVPNNLQGIWNNSNTPSWGSDIHTNINIQMNYWPAEPLNMSDLHMPLLEFIYNMAMKHQEWQKFAKKSGQTKGWTAFTECDIFGRCTGFSNNYVVANAWFCAHLWQHYRYTLDKDYLKNIALPAMLSCSDFWLERLIQDRIKKDGTWVAPNEWSPEHGPNEDAVAHAQQLVWDLFNNTINGIKALGLEDAGVSQDYLDKLEKKFARLDTGLHTEQANGKTILREWKYSPVTVGEGRGRGHRHMSHLMALFPLTQVGPDSEYFDPMINSMDLRGDKSTGWSMGWKINLWARALKGNRARKLLKTALKHSTSYGTDQSKGGIYYNLFDSHAPFQIDGNFGATSGVAEMLLQSQFETINLLPALPDAWKDGSVTGLKATNNFTVDMSWKKGKLTNFKVVSNVGGACQLRYKGLSKLELVDQNGKPISVEKTGDDQITLKMTKGQVLDVDMLTSKGRVTGGKAEPTPVEQISAKKPLRVSGRTIYLPFEAKTTVYSLLGTILAKTSKDVFTLPEQAGQSVVILKCDVKGETIVYKVALH